MFQMKKITNVFWKDSITMQNKYNQALRYEIFEKEEYALAKESIQQAKIIFDIGGHVGYFSEWCRILNDKAEIHYFEPILELYQEAKERLKEDKNLIFNNVWLWAKEEEINFFLNEEKTMQSSKHRSFLNPKEREIIVKMITLEKYFKKSPSLRSSPFPAVLTGRSIKGGILVKMDIEGMEFEVLESWNEKIREMIWSLIVEIHLFDDEKVQQYEKLKKHLTQIFSFVKEEKSLYSEKIRLLFCKS